MNASYCVLVVCENEFMNSQQSDEYLMNFNSNEVTHGQSFGRYVTPTLSIESGGRSSLSQPSLVFLHPSFSLFLVSCFFFRSGRNFNDDASGLINSRSNGTRSSRDVIVGVIVFVDLSLWMKKHTLSLRTSLH